MRDEVHDVGGTQRLCEPRRDEAAVTGFGDAFETEQHRGADATKIADERREVEAIERLSDVALDIGRRQHRALGLRPSFPRIDLVLNGACGIVGR